ncbi:MAG: hypothetical protein E7666_06580 [Ruminococcaceae bacterium]|nr:hypothetical protein [Oscillospiraceae bacterium]
MKKLISPILLNTLKIWGCTWLGYLISVIPMYVMRGNGTSPTTEYLVDAIVGGLATFGALFSFFIWEGRKRASQTASAKELLILSGVPAAIWVLACCVFVGDTFIVMGNPTMLVVVLTKLEVANFGFFTPLPIALIFGILYAAAIFAGYAYGKHHQKW